MDGEICKTLRVTFTAEEVCLLLAVLDDETIHTKVKISYGADYYQAVRDLRNILFNAGNP